MNEKESIGVSFLTKPSAPEIITKDEAVSKPPVAGSGLVKPKPSKIEEWRRSIGDTLKRIKDGGKASESITEALKELSVRMHPLPDIKRLLIEWRGVMVYARIEENEGRAIVRVYAHMPAACSEAITLVLSESGINPFFSTDSFTRPSIG